MSGGIRLVRPGPEHEAAVLAYREDFRAAGEAHGLHGTAGLEQAPSYRAWLADLADNARPETVHPGLVPADCFLALRASDGVLVGMIQLRHTLNDYLLAVGGHIGYSVRPGERRKGYAAEMLRLALEEARALGLERVLVTCDRDNPASERTILRCGGVLENEVPDEGGFTRRYWIAL